MNIWTIKEICKALKLDTIENKISFSGISIDTRTIKKGNLYIPLKGKNFDGHDFIENAFKKGASACLTENYQKTINFNKPLIYVKSNHKALIKLAEYSRNRIKKLITICITGSSGKTTLKEWIFKVFKQKKISYCTSGNYNNEIGMPLTLANMPKNTELCILELGMNCPGEIKKLSKIANPNISIITNIGSAHSGNFKKLEGIADEKSDIFSFLDRNSFAIIPGDSKFYEYLYKKAYNNTKRIFSFGVKDNCEFKIERTIKKKISKFKIMNRVYQIENKSYFFSWEQNIIIILGLAKILKISVESILPNIQNLQPLGGRGQVKKICLEEKTLTIIDESYNSNPESLNFAIKNLENFTSSCRRICIIGDMLELGQFSESYHKNVVNTILEVGPEIIITVGNHSKLIFENLPKDFKKFHYSDYRKVLNKLLRIVKNKDIIMIKGSNSINLHLIVKKLNKLGK